MDAKRDPFFTRSLDLWDEASGKAGSVPLVFRVQAGGSRPGEPLRTIASCSIPSDELRLFGLGLSREGSAMTMPLAGADGVALSGALLHCFIHAGYNTRPGPARPLVSETSAESGPVPRLTRAWSVETAWRPMGEPGQLMLQVRGCNCSPHALLLSAVELHLPGARGWVLVDSPPAELLRTSPVAPPIVELGRAAGWSPLPLSVREARRAARPLQQRQKEPVLRNVSDRGRTACNVFPSHVV